jgi:NADH dehydrogenase [ubiquinone] 1 alpha subcomplex assembly factor 7
MAIRRMVGARQERQGADYRGRSRTGNVNGRCSQGMAHSQEKRSRRILTGGQTISSFKAFTNSIEAIYLIEASPYLQKQQAKLLSGTDDLKKSDIGLTAQCKYMPTCRIEWCEDIRLIPKGMSSTIRFISSVLTAHTEHTAAPFILAHEFFDALPIHVFQNVAQSSVPASSTIITPTGPIKPKHGITTPKNTWHELVVSPTSPYSDMGANSSLSQKKEEEKLDFELTVSKTPTPHSLYLPKLSNRYKKLEDTPDAIIEVSPESFAYVSDFAVRIGGSASKPKNASATHTPSSRSASDDDGFVKAQPSGAALILDYGPLDTIPANTLRGIRSHTTVSPFASPGLVDLSADVDFLALADAALGASPGVEVHGPVEQSFFLSTMGIKERADRLLKAAKDEETRRRLETGWKRLVDRGPNGMGKTYKAMAIVPYKEQGPVRRPIGFGGDIVG